MTHASISRFIGLRFMFGAIVMLFVVELVELDVVVLGMEVIDLVCW